ncbi:MAG: M23 family metallopeptidase [Verrucomicrobia bacterium]|nr:M23 family metallopeptidase [Cytophagales bacterium]
MAKIKYYYNTETCKYEKIKTKPALVLFGIAGFLLTSFVIGLAFVPIYSSYFQSDKELSLHKENQELKLYYELLNKEVKQVNASLLALRERDDNIYRVVFEADPVSAEVRNAGVGGVKRYQDLLEKGLSREDLIIELTRKVDFLKKQMYVQSKSFDEIAKLAKDKNTMLACIPAIQPVSKNGVARLVSGFGIRLHPFYKIPQMHTGLDFAAPRGTPIYATGDGVIRRTDLNYGGYGITVEVEHGYGYATLYAHMQKFAVRIGQKVKRGELIGYIGSTGMSTAPHLHYEVIKNGEKVNPIYYFYNDITPVEYEQLLKVAQEENQSLGG